MEGECKSCSDGESMNAAIKPHPMGKIAPNTDGQVYARSYAGQPMPQQKAANESLTNTDRDSTVEYLQQLKIAPWFEPQNDFQFAEGRIQFWPDNSPKTPSSPAKTLREIERELDEQIRECIRRRQGVTRQFPDEVASLEITRERCVNGANYELKSCLDDALNWAIGAGLITGAGTGVVAGLAGRSLIAAIAAAAVVGGSAAMLTFLMKSMTCLSNYEATLKKCENDYEMGIRELFKRAGVPYPC